MVIKVSVSQQNIDSGQRHSAKQCMVHNAVAPFIKSGVEFGMHPAYNPEDSGLWAITKSGYSRVSKIPMWVRQRMIDFDSGLPVTPFSFKINIPNYMLGAIVAEGWPVRQPAVAEMNK